VLVNREKRLALTARGCVMPLAADSPILCFFPPASEPSRQLRIADIDALAATGHSRCSVQAEEPDLGVVVLHVEDPLPSDARGVELAKQDPQVGDAVHGVFAPHSLTNTWFTGYVNNRLLWPMGQGSKPQRTFSISTPLSSAAVGGMVLDEDGRLLGVMVVTVSDAGMGIAVPAPLIAERLAAFSGG
jgi:S1-C subfamily serine protease